MTNEPSASPLPGRAREARANDEALLAAARAVFAERGARASMAQIAERAGIGVAGIYRRYRNKDELVHHLRAESLRDVVELAQWAVTAEGSPGQVGAFLQRHLAEAESPSTTSLTEPVELTDELATLSESLRTALDELIERDRARGLVPEQYGPGDVMAALVHLRPRLPASPELSRDIRLRQLDYYLRGLAAVGDDDQPGIGLDWQTWMGLNIASAT